MIDLQKCLERQQAVKDNLFNLNYQLPRLVSMKTNLYICKIASEIDDFVLSECSALDYVPIEYEPHGKYEHQRNRNIINIHTNNQKIPIIKVSSNNGLTKLQTVCEMYVDYVRESIEQSGNFTNFKIESKWSGFDTTGHCTPILRIVKD